MTSSNQAQSFFVDGDIKQAAGDDEAATVSYLHAHTLDPAATKEHVSSMAASQKQQLVTILQEWLKPKEDAQSDKTKLGVVSTPDQIWEFIFCLEPEAVTTCFARIDSLLRDRRYQQVIDSCTAILKQYPSETAPVLLQRGLARALMGNQDKEAIADYLRAFLKDKDVTLQVVRNKQSENVQTVKTLMQNCVHSKSPSVSDTKPYKQWLALTIDCCRFLLTFEPNDFRLQMTFVERLKLMHKTDRALAMLNETLDVLRLDEKPDSVKLAETLLRRGGCYAAKQRVEQAVTDITAGLNAVNDALIHENALSNYSKNELFFLEQDNEVTLKVVKDVFGGKTGDVNDLYHLLEKAASKLDAEDRFKSVTKVDNIRACSDLYRALLVLQPSSKDWLFKLAGCYAKLGKTKQAVQIFDKLVEDPHFTQEASVLSARAACYRELGDKNQAQKDYDTLLRNNPRDITLLCERAMVYMEDNDIKALVEDLLTASKINQKQTISHLSKEALVQRTRTRQVLFDYVKSLLQDAPLPQRKAQRDAAGNDEDASDKAVSSSSTALSLSQLLTRLNPADQAAHILMAHAMFHSGCTNDAETKLKKLLQENPQAVDVHVVKLHLGLMKIFTKRVEDGMSCLLEVLQNKGERTVSTLFRDIPVSERAHVADESHQYGIDILQKSREAEAVKQAVKCFTIAILCCRGTDLVLEGLNGGTGVYRSYLARAECMAHLGDQKAAILDFSAAIEINSSCVEGLCGRAFMRLALGDENDCVNDITVACDLDLYTVVAHIHALPAEAKKLLLFWIDHRVVVCLLNYGYKSTSSERLSTGGSASTISMVDETVVKPGYDASRRSSLSSIHPPSFVPIKEEPSVKVPVDRDEQQNDSVDANEKAGNADQNPDDTAEQQEEKKSILHKTGSSTDDLKDALLSLDAAYDSLAHHERAQNSRGSAGTTATSLSTYDDVISSMEKAEILHKALVLGRLLINVDGSNATWHGMYADILIVKGDFEEALRHLHTVMDLTPNDVTAVARAGLINVKMNRYETACSLLRSLTAVDRRGLVYVLKAVDSGRRRKLAEESLNLAEEFARDSKFTDARDSYTLSMLADRTAKLDKLRLRSRCLAKIGDTGRAISDISEVIKDTVRTPQASDYCTRARIFLAEGKEFQACRDYTKAIEIDKSQTLTLIHVKPGRTLLCKIFYRQALETFTRHNYQDCHDLCDVALDIDESDIEMRKLRARAKREISKCCIQ